MRYEIRFKHANGKAMKPPYRITPQSPCAPLVRLLLAVLVPLNFGTSSLRAEDVIVTGCVGSTFNTCEPSCAANLGTTMLYSRYSTAIPSGANRSVTMFGITTNATWSVTPTLGSTPGVYRVYVTKGTTYNCPTDIIVKLVATSGCSLADTNYAAQPEVETSAFQQDASLNVWTPVAIITNSSAKPTITFSWSSGGYSRWYMDEVRFENLSAGPATPARITQVLSGNPVAISGTGPVSHPFALVSSTNPAKALDLWTAEQTNTAGTGSFTFNVSPGAVKARFFRVITQ
jgi:hypothetical protein